MADEVRFNKKIFSLLIERAAGERSLHRFAKDADISYVQLRKLWAGKQENPPGKKLMKKLAENSFGGIEYEDYLFAAGVSETKAKTPSVNARDKQLLSAIESLSSGQKKTVEEFVRFLAYRD